MGDQTYLNFNPLIAFLAGVNMIVLLGSVAVGLVGVLEISNIHIILPDHKNLQVNDATTGAFVGAIILVCALMGVALSMMGCTGSVCLSRRVLAVYMSVVAIVMGLEISNAILLTGKDATSFSFVERFLEEIFRNYNESWDVWPSSSSVRAKEGPGQDRLLLNVHIFSSMLRCCGVASASDFTNGRLRWNMDPKLRDENSSLLPLVCCHYDWQVNIEDPVNRTIEKENNTSNENSTSLEKDNLNISDYSKSNTMFLVENGFCKHRPSGLKSHLFTTGCLSVVNDLLHHYHDHLLMILVSSLMIEILVLALSGAQFMGGNTDLIFEQTHVDHLPFTYENQFTSSFTSIHKKKRDRFKSDFAHKKSHTKKKRSKKLGKKKSRKMQPLGLFKIASGLLTMKPASGKAGRRTMIRQPSLISVASFRSVKNPPDSGRPKYSVSRPKYSVSRPKYSVSRPKYSVSALRKITLTDSVKRTGSSVEMVNEVKK